MFKRKNRQQKHLLWKHQIWEKLLISKRFGQNTSYVLEANFGEPEKLKQSQKASPHYADWDSTKQQDFQKFLFQKIFFCCCCCLFCRIKSNKNHKPAKSCPSRYHINRLEGHQKPIGKLRGQPLYQVNYRKIKCLQKLVNMKAFQKNPQNYAFGITKTCLLTLSGC